VTSETNGLTGWVLAGIGAIVSTLLTGVVTLFRMRESENTAAIAKLEKSLTEVSSKADKCEEDRHVLFTSCEVLKIKLEVLEKRISSIDTNGTDFARKHEGNR
jgi:hypothetical protein